MTTKIYIDTEFNGFGGELISMALAAEDGREFYEVLELPPEGSIDPWVAKHVIPILNKQPVPKATFQHNLLKFLSKYTEVLIVADWPEDLKFFNQMLITGPGRCMSTPGRLYTVLDRNLPDTSEVSKIPHNALEDARALRDLR